LIENCKGNPCCAENFINKLKKKQNCTLRPKLAKENREDYKQEKKRKISYNAAQGL
jgi:hypothetical protein